MLQRVTSVFQLNADDRVPKMAEDFSSDHLKLFPLHDDVITRTIPIDDEYRLKMIYHLIWLREKATMYVSLSRLSTGALRSSLRLCLRRSTFACHITCELCDLDFNFTSDLFAHLSSQQHRQRVRQLHLTYCI